MSRRKATSAADAKRRELREVFDWLIEHNDYSGIGQVIAEHINDGSVHSGWGGDHVRAICSVLVDHAPARVVRDLIVSAKACQSTIAEIEAIRQAAELLGVDYEDVEKLVEQRREREQRPTSAEVH